MLVWMVDSSTSVVKTIFYWLKLEAEIKFISAMSYNSSQLSKHRSMFGKSYLLDLFTDLLVKSHDHKTILASTNSDKFNQRGSPFSPDLTRWSPTVGPILLTWFNFNSSMDK